MVQGSRECTIRRRWRRWRRCLNKVKPFFYVFRKDMVFVRRASRSSEAVVSRCELWRRPYIYLTPTRRRGRCGGCGCGDDWRRVFGERKRHYVSTVLRIFDEDELRALARGTDAPASRARRRFRQGAQASSVDESRTRSQRGGTIFRRRARTGGRGARRASSTSCLASGDAVSEGAI